MIYVATVVVLVWRVVQGFRQAAGQIRANIKVLLSSIMFILNIILRLVWVSLAYPDLHDRRQEWLDLFCKTFQMLGMLFYVHQWFSITSYGALMKARVNRVFSIIIYVFYSVMGVWFIIFICLLAFGNEDATFLSLSFFLGISACIYLFFLIGGITRMNTFKTSFPDKELIRKKQVPLLVSSITAIVIVLLEDIMFCLMSVRPEAVYYLTPIFSYVVPDAVLSLVLAFSYGHK